MHDAHDAHEYGRPEEPPASVMRSGVLHVLHGSVRWSCSVSGDTPPRTSQVLRLARRPAVRPMAMVNRPSRQATPPTITLLTMFLPTSALPDTTHGATIVHAPIAVATQPRPWVRSSTDPKPMPRTASARPVTRLLTLRLVKLSKPTTQGEIARYRPASRHSPSTRPAIGLPDIAAYRSRRDTRSGWESM